MAVVRLACASALSVQIKEYSSSDTCSGEPTSSMTVEADVCTNNAENTASYMVYCAAAFGPDGAVFQYWDQPSCPDDAIITYSGGRNGTTNCFPMYASDHTTFGYYATVTSPCASNSASAAANINVIGALILGIAAVAASIMQH